MRRLAAVLVLAGNLAACDAVNTVVDGFKHSNAVAQSLEQATGLKPQVGFSWNNGRLTSVSVTFPALYDGKPLRELAAVVRTAVRHEFKQTPGTIVLGFSIPGSAPGTTARLGKNEATPPPPALPHAPAQPSPRNI
jgi:hypothetical protein